MIVIFAAGIGAGDTRTGERIAAAAQRFLTFYSGVFALVALTMAVAAGLIATDRIFMTIGSRIVAQAVHRAIAFVSVAFLITHIAMEVVVGKSTAIDSVVPFLARGRTFYVGLGTIGSDLMILLIATGIARRRFAEKSTPLKWRILHGSAYVAWPLAIIHSLVAGRHPKPYVSWSYGACLLAVGLALVLRSVATVRPRQAADHAWPDDAGSVSAVAASVAAQAYLLHTQRAAAAAGLAAGQPAGLTAGPAGQVMPWPAGEPSQWQTTPAAGMAALPGRVIHTPAAGTPVVPGSVMHTPPAGTLAVPAPEPQHYTPPAGMPVPAPGPGPQYHTPAAGMSAGRDPGWAPAPGPQHYTPAAGMPAGPGPVAQGMPAAPAMEYQSPPAGVWPVPAEEGSPVPPQAAAVGGGPPAPPPVMPYQPAPASDYAAPGAHYQTGAHYETGVRYQNPPDWAAPGRQTRPSAEYEALPYQVQALYPATGDIYPTPDDQAGWTAR